MFHLNRRQSQSNQKQKLLQSDSTYLQHSNQKSECERSYLTQQTEKKNFNHNIQKMSLEGHHSLNEWLDSTNPYVTYIAEKEKSLKQEAPKQQRPHKIHEFDQNQVRKLKEPTKLSSSLLARERTHSFGQADSQQLFDKQSAEDAQNKQSANKNINQINQSSKPESHLMVEEEEPDDFANLNQDVTDQQQMELTGNSKSTNQQKNENGNFQTSQNNLQRFTFGDFQRSIEHSQVSQENIVSAVNNESPVKNVGHRLQTNNSVQPQLDQVYQSSQTQVYENLESYNSNQQQQQQSSGDSSTMKYERQRDINDSNIDIDVLPKQNQITNQRIQFNNYTENSIHYQQISSLNQSHQVVSQQPDTSILMDTESPLPENRPNRSRKLSSSNAKMKYSQQNMSSNASPLKKDNIESITERQLAGYKEGIEQSFSASPVKSNQARSHVDKKTIVNPFTEETLNVDAINEEEKKHSSKKKRQIIQGDNFSQQPKHKEGPAKKLQVSKQYQSNPTSAKDQKQFEKEVHSQVKKLQEITRQKKAEYFHEEINPQKIISNQNAAQLAQKKLSVPRNNIQQKIKKIVRANHDLGSQQNKKANFVNEQPAQFSFSLAHHNFNDAKSQNRSMVSKRMRNQAESVTNQNSNSSYLKKLKADYKIIDKKSPSRPQSVKQLPKQQQSIYKMTKISFISNKASESDKLTENNQILLSYATSQKGLSNLKRQSFITNSTNQHNRNDNQYNSYFTSFNKSEINKNDTQTKDNFNQTNQAVNSPILESLKLPSQLVSFNSQNDSQAQVKKTTIQQKQSIKAKKMVKKRKSSKEKLPSRSKSPALAPAARMDDMIPSHITNNYYRRKFKQYKIERSDSRNKLSERNRATSVSVLIEKNEQQLTDKFSSKQSHRYSPFQQNEPVDDKLKTLNFASKSSTIRSPNILEQSKKSFQIQQANTNIINTSNITTPQEFENQNPIVLYEKISEQTGRNNRTKQQVLSPKIISQQTTSNQNFKILSPQKTNQVTLQQKQSEKSKKMNSNKQTYQAKVNNFLSAVDAATQSKEQRIQSVLNNSVQNVATSKSPIDLVYDELNMSGKFIKKKREPIKPFKSANQWSNNIRQSRSIVDKNRTSTFNEGVRNYSSRNQSFKKVTQSLKSNFQETITSNKSPVPNQYELNVKKQASQLCRKIDFNTQNLDIQLVNQNSAQQNKYEYIQNTGIRNFQLVKGNSIQEMVNKTKSVEAIGNRQPSPIKMININNLVQELKKEQLIEPKNEDEVTLTARTANSAMPSVRKHINNIDGLKMIKDQMKYDNMSSIATSPYNLKQSKEEFADIQQFTDRELSEIQQENSDLHMGDGDTVSIMASVQSNLLYPPQQQFDQKMISNFNNISAIGPSDTLSQNYQLIQGNLNSESPRRADFNFQNAIYSSKSNNTGFSHMSVNNLGFKDQHQPLEQFNNSHLNLSNNPSSCQRSNGRFNSAIFNERIQYFMQQNNNTDNQALTMNMLDNCNDSNGNPFDHPMIISPSDIGAGYDSLGDNRTNLNNTDQQSRTANETKDDERSQDSEDPQYLADLNLFMNTTKEKSEEELQRIEKRLSEVQKNIKNIQNQIKEQSVNQSTEFLQKSRFFQNLLSLLDHLLHQHNYLVQRHQTVRQDIVKLQQYQMEQKKIAEQKRQEEERFRQFYQRRLMKLQQQQQMNQGKPNNADASQQQEGQNQLKHQIGLKQKYRILSPQGGQSQGMQKKK